MTKPPLGVLTPLPLGGSAVILTVRAYSRTEPHLAKKSKLAKNARRQVLIERYAEKRAEFATHRLDRLESIAQAFEGVEKTFAIQAGREVRVMVNCTKIDDNQAELLSGEIAEKIQTDMEYPGQIKVVVIRESRATSFAR